MEKLCFIEAFLISHISHIYAGRFQLMFKKIIIFCQRQELAREDHGHLLPAIFLPTTNMQSPNLHCKYEQTNVVGYNRDIVTFYHFILAGEGESEACKFFKHKNESKSKVANTF